MNNDKEQIKQQNIPGVRNHNHFVEAEHVENIKATLKHFLKYFIHEKEMIIFMLIIVICGTICGVYAPSIQSRVIDITISKDHNQLIPTILFMLIIYLLYGLSQLIQNIISAQLSQNIVKKKEK